MPPDHLPLRRAAAILSRVRSEMISRSNWAKLSKTLSIKRPIDVDVLMSCHRPLRQRPVASPR